MKIKSKSADGKIKPGADALKMIELDYPHASAAHKYRLAQAQQVFNEFKAANGRDAKTMEELTAWAFQEPPKAA